jgi:hypothetical protein
MGVFDKMGRTTPTGVSKWFNEGAYLCRVRRCQLFASQQGKGNCVAIEVSVLTVLLNYEAGRTCWIDGSTLPASNRPGEVCSTILQLDRQLPAIGNLKGFLLAATGLTEAQIIQAYAEQNDLDPADPKVADLAFSEFAERATSGSGEALAGQLVTCRANRIRTKGGTPFTRVVWETPSPEVLASMITTNTAETAAAESSEA